MNCSLNGHPSYPPAYSRYRDIWRCTRYILLSSRFLTLYHQTRTTGIILITSFFQAVVFFAGMFDSVYRYGYTSRGVNLSPRLAQVHFTFLCIIRYWEPLRRKLECSTVCFFATLGRTHRFRQNVALLSRVFHNSSPLWHLGYSYRAIPSDVVGCLCDLRSRIWCNVYAGWDIFNVCV